MSHAERGRRDEDRGELPALLQHARQRVPRLRRQLRGGAPHRAAGRPRARRAGSRRRTAATADDHLPRLLLPGPAQRRAAPTRARSSQAVGTPIEMERREERTFCCGAGGAHMWMEERAGAINEERVREAAETGAETLAVACPFCTVMLDDGVKVARRRPARRGRLYPARRVSRRGDRPLPPALRPTPPR